MKSGKTEAQAPPSMVRAIISALILFAGLWALAQAVMVPPKPNPPGKPRTAVRDQTTRPTSGRTGPPTKLLGGHALHRHDHVLPGPIVQTISDRQVRDPQQPIPSYSESDDAKIDAGSPGYACGVEPTAHQIDLEIGDPTEAHPQPKSSGPHLAGPTVTSKESVRSSKKRTAKPHPLRRQKNLEVESRANSATSAGAKAASKAGKRIFLRELVAEKTVAPRKRISVADSRAAAEVPPPRKPTPKKSAKSLPAKPQDRELLLMESPGWIVDDELSESMLARQQRIQRCLDFYYDRPLHNIEDSPWSMMHHMIAWGVDSRILIRSVDGGTKPVSTIGWLCGNGTCDKEKLLLVGKDGKIRARTGPGLQGHDGQFLAMLAQARVSRKQKILVDGKTFTVDDLILEEQLACRSRTELTFRLIGMAHYLPIDAEWKDAQGKRWTIERLLQEELSQPINGTTCGGTHRLMGFTYAVERRRLCGEEITGVWAKAEAVALRHRKMAFSMQNGDGSFSSDFFRSRGQWGDINRKLKTTGHILEWLVFSLPPGKLDDPRITRAVDYLCHLMTSNRYYDWENGPLGHGVRALSLYDERVYGRKPGKRHLEMAEKRPKLQPRTTRSYRPRPTNARTTPRLLRRH